MRALITGGAGAVGRSGNSGTPVGVSKPRSAIKTVKKPSRKRRLSIIGIWRLNGNRTKTPWFQKSTGFIYVDNRMARLRSKVNGGEVKLRGPD